MKTSIPASELDEHLSRSMGDKRLSPQAARKLLESKGFKFPKKNILFHCLKGGAAKTTLAYNCAFRLSQLGARVLLVDLDKQANATHSFDVRRPGFRPAVFVDVVTGKARIDDVVSTVSEGLDLIPSSLENARLEMELVARRQNPRTFYRNLFAPIRARYDVVIFDLPPDLSHNTYLASLYADTICIPVNPDEYSVHGMRLTLASIEGIQKEYDDVEQDILVVWTRFDAREKHSLHYITELRDIGRARIMPVVIRTDVTFKNAQGQGKSVFQLPRKSNAREDVDLLTRELIGLREYLGAKGEA